MANDQMLGEEIIVVGDRVDLVVQMGQVYRAMIEDRIDNGPFLVGIPSRKGVYMPVEQEDDIYLVFYRETGRYIAQMKVVALEKSGEIRYMWLLQKTVAQKNQRREAYRLPVDFDVKIYAFMEDVEHGLSYEPDEVKAVAMESVSSRDISVTGISMLTKKEYEMEERYILSMKIDKAPAIVRSRPGTGGVPPLILTATVKRCIPWRSSNMFNTGMQFFGITKNMSESIARYVLAEQQKQIKRRRLI